MWNTIIHDLEEEIFTAGQKVLPGIYRHLENGREVKLEQEDYLPATLDGRVACYSLVRRNWAELTNLRN